MGGVPNISGSNTASARSDSNATVTFGAVNYGGSAGNTASGSGVNWIPWAIAGVVAVAGLFFYFRGAK